MREDTPVRERLVSAAKKEFMHSGYQKASLRTIAQTAGASTGSVYFFFGSKEELFHAVVDETAAELRSFLIAGAKGEYDGTVSGEENDRAFIECLHAHPEESVILLEKSGDSPMAGFREEMVTLLEKRFHGFLSACGRGSGRCSFDPSTGGAACTRDSDADLQEVRYGDNNELRRADWSLRRRRFFRHDATIS